MIFDPVSELRELLSEFQAVELPETSSIANFWKEVANQVSEDMRPIDLFARLSLITNEIRALVYRDPMIDDDHRDVYIDKIRGIEKLWSPNSGVSNFGQIQKLIKSAPVSDLILVGDALRSHGMIRGKVSLDLPSIRNEAAGFAEKVSKSDVDAEVKGVALMALKTIISAIDNYDVVGPVGLANSIANAKAELSHHEKIVKGANSDGLGQSLKVFFDNLYAEISAGAAAINLIGAYTQTGPALLENLTSS